MRTITLTAAAGEKLYGKLPEDWSEVPLMNYCRLAVLAEPVAEGLTPTVHMFYNEPAIRALAVLVGLPAELLLQDRTLLLHIFQAAPWLFVGPLPEGAEALPTITHEGKQYQHVGDLDGSRGWQMEALLALVKACANPLEVAAPLLAILYSTDAQQPKAAAIQQAAEAFESLPMSLAYPALVNFLRRSMPLHLPIQRYLLAQPQAEQAVSALEKLVSPTSAPRASSWNMPRWLLVRLIRRVRKQLATSSPPSAFTAGPPS